MSCSETKQTGFSSENKTRKKYETRNKQEKAKEPGSSKKPTLQEK
jgi:hypothetical protein